MTRRNPGFPKHMAEVLRENQSALDFYAASAGAERINTGPIPEKRAPRARKAPDPANPLEGERQRDILAMLRRDQRVAWVGRFNRGTAIAEYKGQTRYIRMNTVPGFSDLHGMLKTGRPFYFETKRAGEKPTADQQNFLDITAKHGALAGVVRSVDDALKLLATAG